MKKLFFLSFVLVGNVVADVLPPPPATPAETAAGISKSKYVSPFSLTASGIGTQTNGITAATATNIVRAISATNNTTGNAATATVATNLQNLTRYNVKAAPYLAAGNGSTDDTTALQSAATAAATTSLSALGQFYLPQGVYRTYNTILFNGTYGPDLPGTTLDTGYFTLDGQANVISAHGNTNALRFLNGTRALNISRINLVGTNNTATISANNRQSGFVFNGPGGNFTVNDTVAACFTAGYVFHDITGFRGQNLMALSNFVGFAIGFKADGVKMNVRAERNYYGAFLHYTNSQFTNFTVDGHPSISGVFGYNQVGIAVLGGSATIEDAYFEGNGVAIEIGRNTNNTYTASYTSLSAPDVSIQRIDGIFQAMNVWERSVIRFKDVGNITGSKLYLKNSLADNSRVNSDTLLTVVKSDSSEVLIGRGWMYLAGERQPESRNSWTNITDVPAGLVYYATNVSYNTNQLIISDAPDSDYVKTWYYSASAGKYTNATMTGASVEFLSSTAALVNDTSNNPLYSTAEFVPADGTSSDWLDENTLDPVDLSTAWGLEVIPQVINSYGSVFPQLSSIPTNRITSVAGSTNIWVGNINGILVTLKTNLAAGGWQRWRTTDETWVNYP